MPKDETERTRPMGDYVGGPDPASWRFRKLMPDDGRGARSRFQQGWTRFRGWSPWLQAVVWVVLVVLVLNGLSSGAENTETAGPTEPTTSTTETTPTTERPTTMTAEAQAEPRTSSECEEAFRKAAQVHELRDTHEDLWPAFESCRSIEEFATASENYPGAVEAGVDPATYVENQCLYEPALDGALLCQEL